MEHINILIIGAGVAGLTCAGLLEKNGIRTTIIEKETSEAFNSSGYMLGLLPLGGRVLTELNLKDEYFQQSVEMQKYEIHRENGELNKAYSLDFINEKYGSYRGVERKTLIELLLRKVNKSEIKYGTTARSFQQQNNLITVSFSDNTQKTFDLVIAADGLHSQTREQLWNNDEYSFYDTQWGGWVAWLENKSMNTYKEYWGAASFIGFYPVKDKIGIFLGGPDELVQKHGLQDFVQEVQNNIKPEYALLHESLDALKKLTEPYYWEFHDCKTKSWKKGNVLLLGDAACGFLPTAGVGASMAMDAASALVDELSRTDKEHLEYGLGLFIKREKERVENAQENSRDLGKMMFVKSHLIAGIRDYAIRFYSLKQLTKSISKTIEGK